MHSKLIIAAGVIILFLGITGAVIAGEAEEYTLKAVFFERIARFLDWPDKMDDAWSEGHFVVGILGKNPFGTLLEELYDGRKIKNRTVKVAYFSDIMEIENCHLLYISASEKEHLSKVLKATNNRQILTISDTEGFAQQGVCVNLYLENDKLRFEINRRKIEQSGLIIDPLILKVARIVDSSE